ncbi:hybrid signal transduction histidine kinase B [Chaetomidium leptoderma]|uniref:histidine kinase n=1 Tax=Chaetomidium leptoderma TaxID=669021 RepID=A0AAN6VFF0_9PEZI|nr:hybrid signal transduction histidine kinase B [Chaetomidium leptoderma]
MNATAAIESAKGPVTATPCTEVESSERAAQREIAAYLSAASFPPGMPVCFQEKPLLNEDPTLNALTQLGALRLGVDRAFVSLIDRQYQYVITEMTRSQSLVGMKCTLGDHVAIGVCKIRHCDGVCPATMKAFMDETGEWAQIGPDVVSNRTRYIVNDFRTHPDYKDRAYVKAYPYFTSYLEVPLVSPLGYLLGSYCVVDSHLNDFDNDHIVAVMDEIAASIMAHLENVRIRHSRDRSQHLIQELSGFIQHKPSLQTAGRFQATNPPHERELPGAPIPPALGSEGECRGSGALSTSNNNGNASGTMSSCGSGRQPRPNIISASSLDSVQFTPSFTSTSRQDDSETPPTTPQDDPDENRIEQQLLASITEVDTNDTSSPQQPNIPSEVSEPHGFIGSANIKTTFFRAAATIRRAMDMDGLMFLDAVPSSFVERPDQPSLDARRKSSHEGPFCPAIVKSALSPGGETFTHSSQTELPEGSLQNFIRAYPDGHVFTADELGPIDESYGVGKTFQSQPTADVESLRLRNDIAALFRALPAAKYVIFLPLCHFQRECWYAAALGWVEDPTRAIGVPDIGLVAAFGNSVMGEVSRLEAVAASRAKSDFVSSLSHELRSPLHGIMASSEVLREGMSDRSILSTLDMLDSCATTLLDTFNNLLDHAIVTHSGTLAISGISDIDLGALVEDVVEAVTFGYRSGNIFDVQALSTSRRQPSSAALAQPRDDLPGHPLLITVQIARCQWKLPANVGAWKRIVMNIFGNAFKYTSAGHIDVGLKIVKRTDRAGNASSHISFTVEDTGVGMSSDYLKYHLCTPFSQEDTNAPGMGLGLSIVQQLVNDLGGTVDVKSSLGIGTLVEVLVPLGNDISVSPIIDTTQPTNADENFSRLNGRTVCLITPDSCAAMVDTEIEITKKVRNWSARVEKCIKINAGVFLGMEVIVGSTDCPAPQADLYVLDLNLFNGKEKQSRNKILQGLHARVAPLVLLCSGYGIHLHHPMGPRKLASVFESALEPELNGNAVRIVINEQPSDTALTKLGERLGNHDPLPTRSSNEAATLPLPDAASLLGETVMKTSPSNMGTVSQTQPTKSRHLLLVDDNPINIKLLTHIVKKLNHTFEMANHGLEAVQLFKSSLEPQKRRFDLVFMDISMPVMNGFEATREIRQLETVAGLERCKIIALTGLSSDANRIEASASGCDLFLTKPVKLNVVKGLVEDIEQAK